MLRESQGPLQIQPVAGCSHVALHRGWESLGVEWGCEPPSPGSCVGLSQSECYCKVSGFTGRIPLPLHPPPGRAGLRLCGSGTSLHSTFCFHLSTCTFWRFSHRLPPPLALSRLPPCCPQHLLSWPLPHAPLFLTRGDRVGWVMGGSGLHLCALPQ